MMAQLLHITKLGKEDGNSLPCLRRNILATIATHPNTMFGVVKAIRNNYPEYRYTAIRVFAMETAMLLRGGYAIYVESK